MHMTISRIYTDWFEVLKKRGLKHFVDEKVQRRIARLTQVDMKVRVTQITTPTTVVRKKHLKINNILKSTMGFTSVSYEEESEAIVGMGSTKLDS